MAYLGIAGCFALVFYGEHLPPDTAGVRASEASLFIQIRFESFGVLLNRYPRLDDCARSLIEATNDMFAI